MLEKYRVLAQLGRGGMAEVYLAAVGGPGGYTKLLVLKVLERALAQREEFVRMFADEAKLSARLNHPNVVQTFEIGEWKGLPFIAMEYLEGQPLNKVIDRCGHRVPVSIALPLLCEVLGGLHYAHELPDYSGEPLGIVHRDITPQNILVTYEGLVKVLDFGIAKAEDSRTETSIGTVKGKVGYMAPEHARGEHLDRRADVFSAAVVLWEMLAGKRLWEGLTEVAVIGKLLQGEIPELSAANPTISPQLSAAVMKALSPERENRPESAAAFQRELEQIGARLSNRISGRQLGEWMRETFQEERARAKSIVQRQLEKAEQALHGDASTRGYGATTPAPYRVPILGDGTDVHEAPTALHTGLTGPNPFTTERFGSEHTTGSRRFGLETNSNAAMTNAFNLERARRQDRLWFAGGAAIIVAASFGVATWVATRNATSGGAMQREVNGVALSKRTEVKESPGNCDSKNKPLVELNGELGSDAVLTCDKEYLLRFTTTVLPGSTLKILPGTVIKGDLETKGKLVIQPGARIDAVGTRELPIVFTSAAEPSRRRAGDWGGLIILGQAPTNLRDKQGAPTTGRVEGLTVGGEYGGKSPEDSSGRLKFVRIEYSGTELGPNNEINGLTLGGVGRGTEIEFIQVRYPADDCFEFFGGTVDAKHLICSHVDDDGFDWDFGYQGRLQFLVSTASGIGNDGSNGIEGDNDPNGSQNEPISAPLVYNASLFGKGRVLDGKEHYGMLLRRGTHGRLRNILTTGFLAGIDLRDTSTRLNLAASLFHGNLLENLAFSESASAKKSDRLYFDDDGGFDESGFLKTEGLRISEADPQLSGRPGEPGKPAAPLLQFGAKPPSDGFFDTSAEYVGAFRDVHDDWDHGAWVDYE